MLAFSKPAIRLRPVTLNQDYVLDAWELFVGKTTVRFAHSSRISEKRARSFTEKEPTTLIWIEGFGKDDVLVDVGANVGTYSVWAAVRRGCRVISLEPESLNYAELNKNIQLNGVNRLVRAFCVAASDVNELTDLYLSRFVPSFSHHDAGENLYEGPVTNLADSADARLRQGCVARRLDHFLTDFEVPGGGRHHLKVDVDGLEHKVISGAAGVLEDFDTVLLECDFSRPRTREMMALMAARGWTYSPLQVCLDRGGWRTKADFDRRVAEGDGGSNIIYFRDPAWLKWWEDALEPYKDVKVG